MSKTNKKSNAQASKTFHNIMKASVNGKPENMVDKIAQGKLNRFFKDNTLLPQVFVKDNSKTVAQYLDSVTKGLTVVEFKRVAIG